MKKILFFIILFTFYINVYAIEDIKIDNKSLIPSFDKNTFVYNYYTDKDEVNIKIIESSDNIKSNIIELTDKEKIYYVDNYKIRIFKNYEKSSESYIKELTIKNHDINFNNDKYNYSLTLNDEEYLEINYELSNSNDELTIIGNGNFNKNNNIIKILFKDKVYTINAYKTINVSKVINNNTDYEMSDNKKEIVKLIIITISCVLVIGFFYILFIDKTTISI